MEILQNYPESDDSLKFALLSKKLFTLTQSRIYDRKLLNEYFMSINDLDYRNIVINDKSAMMLVINQLCSIIQPSEVSLVIGFSQFLVNLVKCGIRLQGITNTACKRWVVESLKFSDSAAASDILYALESLLTNGPFDSIHQDLRKLLGGNSMILKHIYPQNVKWNKEQLLALGCLKSILLITEQNESSVAPEYASLMKKLALQILTKIPSENLDKMYFNKIASICLRILRILLSKILNLNRTDSIGELLGIIQVYLFHGIEGYHNLTPQELRPAIMNLPDIQHPVQKKKYFRNRNYKIKNKKQSSKKASSENNNVPYEVKTAIKCSSDSDTSDFERRGKAWADSEVRIEAAFLFHSLVECTQNKELFGYWTQIVASGSRHDARVLTRSVLREPSAKARQIALSTLNDLLVGARNFLTHAEHIEQMSFVSFSGMLSFVITEIHFTLSLLLSTERNIVVLTQGLKCATALIQGTPYSKLKPGLATKIMRHARYHLLHKDPTVRVAALSVFEALSLSEPITAEIFDILARSSNAIDADIGFSSSDFNTAKDAETEEVVVDDFVDENNYYDFDDGEDVQETHESAIVRICLRNIKNKVANEPVVYQSLKLLGTLAFNASSLIFSHLDVIVRTLIDITDDQESQTALHACRVMEIIAGRLADSKSDDGSTFWNLAFNTIISLMQYPLHSLREAACDCLGNIGSEMFAQLSRDKSIIVITVLFGAVRDDESCVRAAGLRALGLLVSLATLEEDTGFLMDLTDVTCTASEDCNLGVRVKAAWALASLCDTLVKRESNKDVEPIPLEIVLPKLYKTSVKAAKDNEKVKSNAVRAIGNILFLCPDRSIINDTSSAFEALITCATMGNDMKVRWNACRAIGTILSRNPDEMLPLGWKDKVFPGLCDLVCNSPNFKVRTNAAWALSVCNSYEKYIVTLWKSIIFGLENSQHVPSYIEYPHRDALVQQLCITLCHLAVHTDISELESLWVEVKDHFEDLSQHLKHFQEHVLPEKAGDLIKAKAQFASFVKQAIRSSEKEVASNLLELFQREEKYDNLDASSILN
ncbi:HEAT repeat-containing protein 6 [Nasonia vitripennis]|uniref:HEAT repeat-containing protein 6 n=1 Tax=Nasonia vitripennis TaxID=7425 RepID=A0A7M7G611_NASVI|nr:HEAT repeat-containing protein 6 [Nasonia vitripennis]